MNEEGDAAMEIWRNKSSPVKIPSEPRRSKFAKQLGGLRGASRRGVPRHNVRLCTVWAPKLVWAKKHPKSRFCVICKIMSCKLFT